MKNRKLSLLALSVALLCTVDQMSKKWILITFKQHTIESIRLTSWLNITQLFNDGAAFGLFQNNPWFSASVFLFGAFVIWTLSSYFLKSKNLIEQWAFPLIISGALGNLLDRIQYGKVIDFIDIHWNQYHWFVFNLADSFICVGVFLLILKQLLSLKKQHPPA